MIYTHYKNGQRYSKEGEAVNPNTGEIIVIYQAVVIESEEFDLYWRSKSEFEEKFIRTRLGSKKKYRKVRRES